MAEQKVAPVEVISEEVLAKKERKKLKKLICFI